MSKKASGLGRGLGDLLEDNSPIPRSSSVVRRDDDGEVSVSPQAVTYVGADEDAEERKPLVFPSVTPIIGGSAAEAESDEAVDEKEEILGLDAEITADNAKDKPEGREEVSKEAPAHEELPPTRSLKAIFRTFK